MKPNGQPTLMSLRFPFCIAASNGVDLVLQSLVTGSGPGPDSDPGPGPGPGPGPDPDPGPGPCSSSLSSTICLSEEKEKAEYLSQSLIFYEHSYTSIPGLW